MANQTNTQKTKTYKPFSSQFKNEEGKIVGENFMGIPKEWFSFTTKIYVDLPVAQGDKNFTYQTYSFLELPTVKAKLFGIPVNKIKQNNQMENCVNFFVSDSNPLPVLDLSKDTMLISRNELINTIKTGMEKTKEFYAKNPPVKNNEIKVFETTYEVSPNELKINNLMDKFYNGKIKFGDETFVVVYLPFDGTKKNLLVPESAYKSNNNSSFNLNITQNQIIGFSTRNLNRINKFNFVKEACLSKAKSL